jgi:hypothetical protein
MNKFHVNELFKCFSHMESTNFSLFLNVVLLLWFHIKVSVEVDVNLHVWIGPLRGKELLETAIPDPNTQAVPVPLWLVYSEILQ